jgi:triosephosphate isomerase
MIAPPFTALETVRGLLADSPVKLGAQNVAWAKEGAFTGEISPPMLLDAGVEMVIIGHSERRHVFGESNALINQRLRGALDFDLSPILCLGETLEEREQGKTLHVVEEQLRQGLAGLSHEEVGRTVIAYEPVWAIGTGKTASTEQAQEVHEVLRNLLAQFYQKTLADRVRILYGGSVNAQNVDSLMAQPDIDGVLVGGAALQAESFARIIHYT